MIQWSIVGQVPRSEPAFADILYLAVTNCSSNNVVVQRTVQIPGAAVVFRFLGRQLDIGKLENYWIPEEISLLTSLSLPDTFLRGK